MNQLCWTTSTTPSSRANAAATMPATQAWKSTLHSLRRLIQSSSSPRTAVYEQQRWEGKIIDERDAKQGRGRPRKKYRVRWEDSWTDGARLTTSGLMQDWRERRRLNLGVEPRTFVDFLNAPLCSLFQTCSSFHDDLTFFMPRIKC